MAELIGTERRMIVPEHLDPRLNPKVQRAMVWTGPLVVVALCAGMIPITGFIPIPSPLRTGDQIAAMYVENQLSIRVGCAVMMIGGGLWATWCAVIAMFMRRMESGYPSLIYASLCCIGYGVWIFEAFPLFWAVAAFRADAVAPDITRMLNDVGWFFFVFTGRRSRCCACAWRWRSSTIGTPRRSSRGGSRI
jgi:hypothetical protein